MLFLSNENFKDEVECYEGKVLVDFWAPWCGPCRAQAPILDSLAEEMGDSLKIGKVNTDEQQDLAARYGIMSIPTLILFEGGVPVQKAVGLHSLSDLKNFVG